MLRSKLSLLALTCTVISFIFVQGCGDDTDRKKGAVTDYSNYVDLRLTTLEVDVGELEPAFDPDYVGPYTLNLATDVESINITAATNAEDAVLEIYKQEFVLDDIWGQFNTTNYFTLLISTQSIFFKQFLLAVETEI